MIYHVDETMPNNNSQWYPGYTNYGHYLVALEQSDSLWELERDVNYGNHGDPYPGSGNRRAFSDTTVPDSKDYVFTSTYVAVENISDPADTMTADFKVFPVGVTEIAEYTAEGLRLRVSPLIGHSEFRISFSMIEGYNNARIDIYDAVGRLKRSFDQLNGDLIWQGRDNQGDRIVPGVYFIKLSIEGLKGDLTSVEKIILVR
jgi:hypothetical protein